MESFVHRPAKLRTKTGCLTCRSRRKKCDERTPTCGRCSHSNRDCIWPTAADLEDRRFSTHQHSRYLTGPASRQETVCSVAPTASIILLQLSDSVARGALSRDLEGLVARHFSKQYFGLLLLPNCHPDFITGWGSEIQRLMRNWASVRYGVLCNAASNLHFIEANGPMQELALMYYSRAIRGLSDSLSKTKSLESSNGVLVSMMLLYIHGCIGRGTYFDIPRHLNAAARILALRLFERKGGIKTVFERLAVESVIYQTFIVSTGLWSDEEVNQRLDFEFKPEFWLRAERSLSHFMLFPRQSYSTNSPVLGIPVSLFRLALTMKQLFQGAVSYEETALDALRGEIRAWEDVVLNDQETDELSHDEKRNNKHAFYKDASYLFILIISLLSQQLPPSSSTSPDQEEDFESAKASTQFRSRPPLAADPDSWQIQKAMSILETYKDDDEWASCFIGNWPIYTIGFFVARAEHIHLVRSELRRRWQLTKFNYAARFCNNLEKTWSQRGLLADGAVEPLGLCHKMTYFDGAVER